MNKLSTRNMILIGLTLFSMFFGAGNLIFPPFLGAQAGTQVWSAMLGFAVTAIGFPIMGVAAVAMAGGLDVLAGRVHPKFAFVFTLLIYLSIGPCLAIPRTASTSFEMAVLPFLSEGTGTGIPQIIYSAVFFAIAFTLALKPDKLTDRLGKILTPCLLTLILIIFIGCLMGDTKGYGVPLHSYVSGASVQGFLDGYQTMDTIAALNFGIIISLNIKTMGLTEERGIVKATVRAGFIAGALLLAVYAALAHIGAITGGTFGVPENGARALTLIVRSLYGNFGVVILALIFFIACLNTCVGLLSCCSKYFGSMIPSIGYRVWVGIFAGISLIISNVGLNRILEISVPVLNVIYPVAIVLILLAFLQPLFGKTNSRYIYRCCVVCTAAASVTAALEQSRISLPVLTRVMASMPWYSMGLGWLLPAAVGCMAGLIITIVHMKKERNL